MSKYIFAQLKIGFKSDSSTNKCSVAELFM